jgi:hypothetical protein
MCARKDIASAKRIMAAVPIHPRAQTRKSGVGMHRWLYEYISFVKTAKTNANRSNCTGLIALLLELW